MLKHALTSTSEEILDSTSTESLGKCRHQEVNASKLPRETSRFISPPSKLLLNLLGISKISDIYRSQKPRSQEESGIRDGPEFGSCFLGLLEGPSSRNPKFGCLYRVELCFFSGCRCRMAVHPLQKRYTKHSHGSVMENHPYFSIYMIQLWKTTGLNRHNSSPSSAHHRSPHRCH